MLKTNFMLAMAALIMMSCSAHKFEKTQNGVVIKLEESKSGGAAKLHLKVITDEIIQVLVYPTNETAEPVSLTTVEKEWPQVEFDVQESQNNVVISTKKLQVEVSKFDGRITYLDKSGNLLLKEDGRLIEPVTLPNDSGVKMKQYLDFQDDEAIYGLGQYRGGVMNWRGHVAELKQENTGTAVPVFVSTKGYGVLWDNSSFTRFVDKQQTFISSELGDALNYYFFYGPKMDDVIAGYREVTGAAPMFPKWAFGYVQSRENYFAEKDLMSAALEFRKREIPLDVIIKDWNYWEKGQWGQKTIRKDLFPDPKAMVDKLHDEMNIHTLISIWPNLEKGSADYEDFVSKGEDFYFPMESWDMDINGYAIYNVWNKEARDLYWEQVQKGILVHGFNGLWCDVH